MSLMNSTEISHFINGLKVFLKHSGMTQEEFAQGVTSKVNMSNILRGNSGTSEKMRRALASKADMSVEDLVSLGKTKKVNDVEVSSAVNGVPITITHDAIASMNALEILNQASEFKNAMLEAVMSQSKHMSCIISTLAQQRDELMILLDEHKASVNVIEQPLITLNRDKVIKDCNRVACEVLGIFPGNPYNEVQAEIEQVFATGKTEYVKVSGVQGAIYPVLDRTGNVKQVVILLRALRTNQEYPIGVREQ